MNTLVLVYTLLSSLSKQRGSLMSFVVVWCEVLRAWLTGFNVFFMTRRPMIDSNLRYVFVFPLKRVKHDQRAPFLVMFPDCLVLAIALSRGSEENEEMMKKWWKWEKEDAQRSSFLEAGIRFYSMRVTFFSFTPYSSSASSSVEKGTWCFIFFKLWQFSSIFCIIFFLVFISKVRKKRDAAIFLFFLWFSWVSIRVTIFFHLLFRLLACFHP